MIFVTVGTTLVFDELIKSIDNLVSTGEIEETVICQIGNGEYIPQNCQYYRFKPSIDEDVENASLVICHGGTGSTLGMLAKGKNFISVANPLGVDNHQSQFLQRLHESVPIIWTQDLSALPSLIHKARNFNYGDLSVPCLANDLLTYIKGL